MLDTNSPIGGNIMIPQMNTEITTIAIIILQTSSTAEYPFLLIGRYIEIKITINATILTIKCPPSSNVTPA